MTTQEIEEAIKFNAHDIAVEIKVAEDLQNSQESRFSRDCAKAAAYEQIREMIFGGD